MTITIRLFASLSEEFGFNEKSIDAEMVKTISDVWDSISNQPPPENLLCALNHEYARFADEVRDGVEVAFFPPVNGG
jgi:molybdopterin synthase sulfur carrier subunit